MKVSQFYFFFQISFVIFCEHADVRAFFQISVDSGFAQKYRTTFNIVSRCDANLSPQSNLIADVATAGNPYLGSYQTSFTNHGIVANLNLII